ncbi:hypothetical protein NDGK_01917 [Clostridiales bacterium CHKCI001]|nr:hypothetical protein NDGK_01917 [Clostridiales bacterium CHKCI001]
MSGFMLRKNKLFSQIERFTYDKRMLHKNILQWKASLEEANKALQGKKKEKSK